MVLLEGVVGKPVRVQIPPSAPAFTPHRERKPGISELRLASHLERLSAVAPKRQVFAHARSEGGHSRSKGIWLRAGFPFFVEMVRVAKKWLVGKLVCERSALLPSARHQTSPPRASPMPRRASHEAESIRIDPGIDRLMEGSKSRVEPWVS